MEDSVVSRPRFEDHVKPSVPVAMNTCSYRYWDVSALNCTDDKFFRRIQFALNVVEILCQSVRGKIDII